MIVEIVDTVRNLLPVPADTVVDDAVTEPYKVLPGRLYVWPDRLGAQQLNLAAEAGGFFDDSTLRIRILYTVASKGEQRVKTGLRDVSIELDQAAAAAIAALWANRVHPLWWHLVIENVRPDAVRSLTTRAIGLSVALKLNDAAIAPASGGS